MTQTLTQITEREVLRQGSDVSNVKVKEIINTEYNEWGQSGIRKELVTEKTANSLTTLYRSAYWGEIREGERYLHENKINSDEVIETRHPPSTNIVLNAIYNALDQLLNEYRITD